MVENLATNQGIAFCSSFSERDKKYFRKSFYSILTEAKSCVVRYIGFYVLNIKDRRFNI